METIVSKKEVISINGIDISLHDILDNLGSVILVIKINEDGSTVPVWGNRKHTEITDYLFEEHINLKTDKKNTELFHEDDYDLLIEEIKLTIKERGKERSFILRLKSKKGIWKWFYFTGKAITLCNDPNYLLCTGFDLMSKSQKRFRKFIQETNKSKNQDSLCKLTKIEKEIIKQIINGLSIKEIAQKRKRSFETINNQKRNIYKKLCVNKISDLVIFALENGIS